MLALAITGCGGGGGGGGGGGADRSNTSGDFAAPTANILFPPSQSRTDATRITVRGTAADDGTITSLRVNGIEATSGDGFARWSATVALEPGTNTLVVETADDAVRRNFDTAAAQVELVNEPQMVEPADVVVDAARDRILVVDGFSERVLATDLDGTARRVVSDDTDSRLGLAALDPAGDRLFLHDRDRDPARLVALDLATGQRTVVATLSGLSGSTAAAIAYDPSPGSGSERVLLVDRVERAVFSIAVANGARSVLSNDMTGTGAALVEPLGLAVDPGNGRALVSDYDAATGQSALVAIDLATGNRTFVSPFQSPGSRITGLALDAAAAVVYAIDGRRIWSIDVSSGLGVGSRAVVSDATAGTGAGEAFDLPAGIALDAAGGRLLVSDAGLDAIMAVDPATGDRTAIATNDAGSGERMTGRLEGVQVDSARGVAFVLSQSTDLWRVDLDTGARTRLVDDARLSGMRDIALDSPGNRILGVAELVGATPVQYVLRAIDLDSGAITTLAGNGLGTGGDLGSSTGPFAVALDAPGNRLLITRRPSSVDDILAVDLGSGDRVLVSASAPPPGVGGGRGLTNLTGIALDTPAGELYAVGSSASEPLLYAIELASGDRRLVSDELSPGEDWDTTTGAIALDAARERVLLVRDLNEVIALPGIGAIDLASGARAMLSDGANGSGTRFLSPGSIDLDRDREVALVPDSALGALLAVDLVSGDRVILSR